MIETPTSLGFEAVMARDPVQRFAGWAGALTGWRRHGPLFTDEVPRPTAKQR